MEPRQGGNQIDKTEVVLELRDVSKKFGPVTAVDHVRLAVERGEVLTLLGPSGSGKTTILRMIGGFEQPTSGRILIAGTDAAPLSPAERRIGFVFQHHALFPHMTVGENIAYPLKRHKWAEREREARIPEMLRLIHLEGHERRLPRQLSGGQQQRVALARALAFRPRFLLMDEPLGALDRALRYELAEEIRRIHRENGATMIYVTHDQEEALTLSDRIAVMRRGKIIQIDEPEVLYERPRDSFIAEFMGECNLFPVEAGTRHTRDRADVTIGGQRLSVPMCGEGACITDFVLAVRPTKTQLNPDDCELELRARVVELLYLGEVVRVKLRMEDGTMKLARVDVRRMSSIQIGDEVVVGIDADDVVLVPRTEPPTNEELMGRTVRE